jgi:endonuclease/exonuclease/phosphatase (EEP) superfamily protein YafD
VKFTFTSMTYNLWQGWCLDDRLPALDDLMRTRSPDLLGTQELHPDSRKAIDAALPGHARVQDEAPGWAVCSNIWWDRATFDLVEYGAEDVGILAEHAALFWVRLRPIGVEAAPSILYSTAHLTWPGHPREVADDRSPRVEQARAIAAALRRLGGDGPTILCTDINDYARPLWALYDEGFREPFGSLGRTAPVTHPVFPLPLAKQDRSWPGVHMTQKTLDWQFFRGPLRPRSGEVVEYFRDGIAPSDHKPVVCTFTLDEGEQR